MKKRISLSFALALTAAVACAPKNHGSDPAVASTATTTTPPASTPPANAPTHSVPPGYTAPPRPPSGPAPSTPAAPGTPITKPRQIVWDASPNHSSRGSTKIDTIVLHTTEGAYASAVS